MSDINKFTTKEVLNKVLLDSSGNSVAANSHTSQEALNAVLDVSNSRLNVSLGGSNTISGDVTITGDLTVQGGGSLAFDEIIEGTQVIDVDSTEALLVRKNGDSGDVFIVDTQNSRVGVGGAPSTDVEFFNTASDTASEVAITSQSSGGNASALILRSNRNNTVGSHTVVTNGQFLGQILFQGSDGTDYEDAARIFATVDGSPAGDATDMPGALNFATTADGSDSMTTHMKIDNAGNVLIGTTSTFGRFYVQNNVVDQTGLLIKHAPASTSTASVGNISADNSNATATNGVLRVHHEDPPANVKMIQVDTTGSNTVKFSVDEDGDGYFAGSVGIGTASTDGTLHVHTATAGSVAADGAADDLVVENSGAGGITILTPNNALGQLAFGSPADAYGAFIGWKSDDNQMTIATANDGDSIVLQTGNKVTRMVLDDNSRISLTNNDGGSTTGTNTVFGKLAGNALASGGNNNVLIGEDAGNDLTTSDHNVAIGFQAFAKATTSADNNTVVGNYAMGSIVSNDVNDCVVLGYNAIGLGVMEAGASGVVAVGRDALKSLTSGDGNVALGFESAKSMTTGARNVVIGYQAGDAMTVATRSVAIGYGALSTEDVGDRSIAIGFNSLFSQNSDNGSPNVTTGNLGIGDEAGFYNQTGQYNTLIGSGSGKGASGQSNSQNTAVGYSALNVVTTGSGNVAIGYTALDGTDDGGFNTAVGFGSLGVNCGDGSVAIGSLAGSVYTGNQLVAVGQNAARYVTSGAGNTTVGFNSAGSLVEGQFNTVLGYNAFDAGQEDSQCVAIGYEALTNADVSDTGSAVATHNTAVGYASGDVVTTGTKNTLIGSATDPSANSGTNQTVIGFSATGQADNSVTLGDADVTAVYMAEDSGATIFCGDILSGRSSAGDTGNGHSIRSGDSAIFSRNASGETMQICRNASDGQLIQFKSNGNVVGDIRNDGGTVSLTGFSGGHESSSSDSLEIGMVVSTIDEEHSKNHAKVEKSKTVGDKRVYGVVSNLEGLNGNNVTVASVGISSIKVTGSCEGGDLLESNGDGTAKVQSDDIIRSKTIGKVTMGNSTEEVKLVSCVLYCG